MLRLRTYTIRLSLRTESTERFLRFVEDEFLQFVENVAHQGREVLSFQRIRDRNEYGAIVTVKCGSYGKTGPNRLIKVIQSRFPSVTVSVVRGEYDQSGTEIGIRRLKPRSRFPDAAWHRPDGNKLPFGTIESAAERAADLIFRSFDDNPSWSRINGAMWKAIGSSGSHVLTLSAVDSIARTASVRSDEVFAVLTFLSSPAVGALKMEFRSDLPVREYVPQEEVVRMLTAWWRAKSISNQKWKTWASRVRVCWVANPKTERDT